MASRGDALAVVAHRGEDLARPRHGPSVTQHLAVLAAIFDGVVDQVLEQLHQFVMLADHRRQIGSALRPSR